ncbi:uncharacterized protein [Heterodontus francisci]|uniref:uncharacterized protein isoform X2 n=1 Tax=Heterodontus francisci TaxID=7792 RepID=UPI00355B6715
MSPSPTLWILAALSGINTEKFTVIQKVPRILADIGQTVFLPCTYAANLSKAIGSYSWYKDSRNGIEVSNGTTQYRGRIYKQKEAFFHGDASIIITDVRVNDSGVYYCKVQMMQLGEEYGAGTNLTVRGKTKSTTALFLTLFISAAVEVGILLIVVLRCVQLRRKKAILQIQRQETNIPDMTSIEDVLQTQRQGTDIPEITSTVDVQQAPTQEIDIPAITPTAASFTSFLSTGVQDLVQHIPNGINGDGKASCFSTVPRMSNTLQDQTGIISPSCNQDVNLLESDPLCMDVNQEEQSIYIPMGSVKEFNHSFFNVMDAETSPINSQNQKTTRDCIQYTEIQINYFQQRPSLNAISERGDLEQDFEYEELNATA